MQWIKLTARWCYRTFWYGLVGLIITIAIAISLLRIYLPDVKSYRAEIEQLASSALDKQVRIASMDAKLSGITPLIVFNDVYLLDSKGRKTIVHFDQALLTIDFFRTILNMRIVPESFTVVGVNLGIRRKADGNYTIQGLSLDELGKQFTVPKADASADNDELARWFFERSELSIKKSTVVWRDSKQAGRTIRFDNVNFDLRNDGDRHQLSGTVTLPKELGEDFEVAFDFKGNILNPEKWFGRVYSKARQVDLVNWGIKPHYRHARLDRGKVDLELWGNWQGGQLNSFTADINARDFLLNFGEQHKPFSISQLSGLLDWRRDEQGWKLRLNHFTYKDADSQWPDSSLAVQYQSAQQRVVAYADYLRLDDIRQALLDARVLDASLQQTLTDLAPAGVLTHLHADYVHNSKTPEYFLATDFSDLSVAHWKSFPGVKNISGRLWMNQDIGRLELDSKQLNLAIPSLFRSDIAVEKLQGQIDWYADHHAWHVRATQLDMISTDIRADAGFSALIPRDLSSPYLDLQVRYRQGRASQVSRYLPVTIMDHELVDWLDHAFHGGEVTEGGLIFNGRLSGFPYADHSGTLLADFQVKDVPLNYQAGWPQIAVNQAHLRITSENIEVLSRNSQLYNSQLTNVHVSIDQFLKPVLKISGDMRGQTTDLARYLVHSSLAPEAREFVDQTKITGNYQGNLKIRLPLSKQMARRYPFAYHGMINVEDNELDMWQGKLVASALSGKLKLNTDGVSSENITYRIMDGHAQARIYTSGRKAEQTIRIATRGKIDTRQLRHYVKSSLLQKITGKTDWQAMIRLGGKAPGYVQLFSQLQGVTMDLPSPLSKQAQQRKSLDIKVVFPEKQRLPVYVNYGSEVSSVLVFNLDSMETRPLERGDLVFSFATEGENFAREVATLPAKQELLIRGRLLDLNIDQWLTLINRDVTQGEVGLTSLNIPLRLDMDYLRLFTNSNKETQESAPAPAKDPRSIFPFDGEIRALLINEIYVGHVHFRMEKHNDGLQFSDVSVQSDLMDLKGQGSWFIRDGQQRTNLLMTVKGSDLGKFISELGYSAILKGGDVQAVIQLNWADSPDRFTIEKLNGSIGAVISDGVLSDVKPGAGRLLGLLSIAELPRRLTLDFSELGDGLSFKQIVGRVEIRDGNAYTDTLKIVSPIALIEVEGRTGLAARDFDQRVKVIPSVTGTLPAISWLAWGGQIGALTFLIEKMIGDQFNEEIATEYSITGSWDNPQIRQIKKPPPVSQDDEDESE